MTDTTGKTTRTNMDPPDFCPECGAKDQPDPSATADALAHLMNQGSGKPEHDIMLRVSDADDRAYFRIGHDYDVFRPPGAAEWIIADHRPCQKCPAGQDRLEHDVEQLLYPFDGEPGYEWVRDLRSRLPHRRHTGRVATCRDCRGPVDGAGINLDDPWAVSPGGLGLTCPLCKSTVAPF